MVVVAKELAVASNEGGVAYRARLAWFCGVFHTFVKFCSRGGHGTFRSEEYGG